MAGIVNSLNLTLNLKRVHVIRCCSSTDNDDAKRRRRRRIKTTPKVLKIAVSGVTELLRLFSSNKTDRLNEVTYNSSVKISPKSIDDIVRILKSDYDKAYFVTGDFTSSIYAEDCIFRDPTISFQGTELYARNLKLLVPFFQSPSITLKRMEKGVKSNINFVQATWKLRTYLKFPWRPLILIEGSTVYELDDDFKIVRHVESWNVSAFDAIGQIFMPNLWRSSDST